MRLPDLLGMAGAEISAHKVRSALTSLSLAVGIAAILFTFSATGGMKRRLNTALELAGPGRIQIEEKRNYTGKGLSPGLTWSDAKEIRRLWPELHMVYPMKRRWSTPMVAPGFKTSEIVIWGTTEEWAKRDWVYRLEGRFLNSEDVRSSARVCVLLQPGGWVKKEFWAKFFPEKDLEKHVNRHSLLGRPIRLESHTFTVVGIIHEPPKDKDPRWGHNSYGGSGDVLVPITAYQKYLLPPWPKGENPDKVQGIYIDTGDVRAVGPALRRVEQLLMSRHRGERDFEVKDYREIIAGRTKRMRERAMVIFAIGIVAILAGGIGIMNVTLATIFSRIREIGIRRALGATRADVIAQFATEASCLGFLSGLIGLGLGLAAIKKLAPDPDWMIPLTAGHVGAALGIAVGTAFLFSLFPAYKAASFDPVESLRYE